MRSTSTDFRLLLDAAPDAMIVLDPGGRVTALNPVAEQFLGWAEPELLGQSVHRFIPARFQRLFGLDSGPAIELAPDAARATTVSCFAHHRDGSEFPVEVTRRPIGRGEGVHSLMTLRDLTQWRRAQETRSRNNEQASATLEAIGDSVITTDANCLVTYLNPVAERLTGWAAAEALGQPLDAILPLISEASRLPIASTAMRCLAEGRSVDLENGVLLLRRDGTEVPVGDSAAPVHDRNGDTVGVVLVIQDESEKRRVGHRLSFEASHDALTGLINRREFERRLARVVGELPGSGSTHMLLCIDLDRFKVINDTCGHDAGDALLRDVGPLLSRHLRKRDSLARLGGDEFGVLLENCPLVEAERIAENLRAGVEQHEIECVGKIFTVAASIGLVPLTAESGGIEAVLRAADVACYSAKEGGGNRVHREQLSTTPGDLSLARARRVTRLARAVDEGQFRLYAQPIIPLQADLPSRARLEILLRLPSGKTRVEAAADFLPQAERYNLMPMIDRWVVRETIALLGLWRRAYPDAELPVCSINISASSLADDSLVSVLTAQLDRYGVPADTICFEITEATALADLPRAVRFLGGLRNVGCGMALEDLGRGVTSFTYLKALPVDFLKIGGHFVRDVVDDPMYGSIVSAVDRIGRTMGIFTVAKQVGNAHVLHKLRTLGIGYAQGRALTPPVPLTDSDGRVTMPSLQHLARRPDDSLRAGTTR